MSELLHVHRFRIAQHGAAVDVTVAFNLGDDMNVFADATSDLGPFEYTVEDDSIIILENNEITGLSEGITKITVSDTQTHVKTNIWVKVTNHNIKIDAGYRFSIAVKSKGTVWTWGQNSYGQLGLGDTVSYNEPQEVLGFDAKIVDAAAGYYHAVALTESGEVYTWGYNGYGQLGVNVEGFSKVPVKVEGLSNIVKVDAFKYITTALDKDGNVYVWGNEHESTPTKLTFNSKIIDIAGDIVLTESRRAYNLSGTRSYGNDLIKISAGENHYLGLTSKGEVIAWGYNGYGQLGNNTTGDTTDIPVKVVNPSNTGNIANIVEISAGDNYSVLSDVDGNVYTFGYNGNERLGVGSAYTKPTKVDIPGKMELVSASENGHTLISDWDGYVYSVGLNSDGQLGLGDYEQKNRFKMVGEFQIEANPSKVVLEVGQSIDIELAIGGAFNLKDKTFDDVTIDKRIANKTIAKIVDNTITGRSIGKTVLTASYEGIVGNSGASQRFYRNVEIEVIPEGAVCVPKVQNGNKFGVALRADGTVWTWGINSNGQLGQGNTIKSNEPVQVEFDEVIKDISVGNSHVLALSESGKVYAFGYCGNGQIGYGSWADALEPKIVVDSNDRQLKDIVRIEAGTNVSFAITSKGVAYGWGNGYGLTAQKINAQDVVDITSKYYLDGKGDVYSFDTGERISEVGLVAELDEGTDHTVMLTVNQEAYAIGDNTFGQLGNMNNNPSTVTPVALRKDIDNLFDNIKEVKAGDRFTIIVTNDGKIYTVGINNNNELGIENTQIQDRNTIEQTTTIEDAIFVDAGYGFASTITSNGTVYTWGLGTSGQLGNRRNLSSVEPVMVGDYIVRTTTNHVTLGVNEEKYVEGYVDYFNVFTHSEIGITYASKDRSIATLRAPEPNEESTRRFGIRIKGNKIGTTIVTASQDDSTNMGVIQVEVIDSNTGIEPNVVTNGTHTVSLRVDGKVFTWGDNTYGQLGLGTTKPTDEPTEVKFPTEEGEAEVQIVQIAVGENHTVALDSQGYVWVWGRNNYYQLGGQFEDKTSPYKLTELPKVTKIAAGNNNTMVITEDTELYAWGFNSYGDLGIGSFTNKVSITKVEGIKDIIDISGGRSHFIALNRAGKVFTTGSNLYGQLGIDTSEIPRANQFTEVEIPEKIGSIDAGELSNITVSVDGHAYVWGGNTYSQLGIEDKTSKFKPVFLEDLENIREAEIGKTHAIIRNGDGKVFMAGANNYGQLGDGTLDSIPIFTENTLIDEVFRISSGNTYSLFLRNDGFVWACGDYYHGEPHKKSRTNSKIPVLVGSETSSLERQEITLEKSEIKNIMANAKYKFNLIYVDENEMSNFNFTSFNTDIADINEHGDIRGIREGTTWVRATDTNTGKEHIAIVRVIDNTEEYSTHVAPKVAGGENFAITLK
ncbi:MAG: hypothetical protein IJH59_01630, partial [Firmicutes bacterium]|nr:hypothetical protein [Bacillota bacterium]